MTEKLLKTALNPNQSINQWISIYVATIENNSGKGDIYKNMHPTLILKISNQLSDEAYYLNLSLCNKLFWQFYISTLSHIKTISDAFADYEQFRIL